MHISGGTRSKFANAQLNNLEQHPPFTWRSEQKTIQGISGYNCYSVDEDGVPYNKESVDTNHQMQRLPASLMNSFQSKEDVKVLQICKWMRSGN